MTSGAMTVFRAQHTDLEVNAVRNPVDAWDIDGIAGQYKLFIDRWSEPLVEITAGRVSGAEAVKARTEVMGMTGYFLVIDPLLPAGMMPPDWPRARAREVFIAVYDGLAEPAEEHVRAVVASVGDEPGPDVRAHTVEEMAAGICGT